MYTCAKSSPERAIFPGGLYYTIGFLLLSAPALAQAPQGDGVGLGGWQSGGGGVGLGGWQGGGGGVGLGRGQGDLNERRQVLNRRLNGGCRYRQADSRKLVWRCR